MNIQSQQIRYSCVYLYFRIKNNNIKLRLCKKQKYEPQAKMLLTILDKHLGLYASKNCLKKFFKSIKEFFGYPIRWYL